MRRRPAAMFFTPAVRRAPMARLRQVAIARRALPVRTCEASSAKVVSRTWCRASIVQWSRTSRASWDGVACSAVRLVTAYTVLTVVLPVLWSVRRRLIWAARRAPGKRRLFTVAILIRRISERQWPVPLVRP